MPIFRPHPLNAEYIFTRVLHKLSGVSLGEENLDVVTGMMYSNPRDEHKREGK